jgi:PEGA domain-containing protein
MNRSTRLKLLGFHLLAISLMLIPSSQAQKSELLGELRFEAGNKPAKTSGVWIDGQYLGYLKELKGSKRVILMPGEHQISVRQAGFHNFEQSVVIEPGQTLSLRVNMDKDPDAKYPAVTAELKISADPDRAAVFLDERYVGHAHEFSGMGRGMLVSPGKHRLKIALPGFQTVETEIVLVASQKYEIKTDLLKGTISQAEPLIKQP